MLDPATAPGSFVRHRDILDYVESRLHLAPKLRRKLVYHPLGLDEPRLIDDPDFDLEFHVRHLALPKPRDWRQLKILTSRLISRSMDMHRPLWEMYIIEGLENLEGVSGDAFAVLFKIHHAKSVRETLGKPKMNDLLLTVIGSALRRYLDRHGELPEESLLAMCPINVRGAGDPGEGGNFVSGMRVSLGRDIADPTERLAAITASSAAGKTQAAGLGSDFVGDMLALTPYPVRSRAMRSMTEFPERFNVEAPAIVKTVVTNAPNPPGGHYFTGSKVVSYAGYGPINNSSASSTQSRGWILKSPFRSLPAASFSATSPFKSNASSRASRSFETPPRQRSRRSQVRRRRNRAHQEIATEGIVGSVRLGPMLLKESASGFGRQHQNPNASPGASIIRPNDI